MKNNILTPNDEAKLQIKESAGWFAAGEGFRCALGLLSDGAFKLFAYLSLHADRRTGRLAATYKDLAAALAKSKRIIGTYIAELEAKGICIVCFGKNQFAPTIFEISDRYWPYHRIQSAPESPDINAYIERLRECFEGLGCTSGKFGAAAIETAKHFQQRTIPFDVVRDAMLLGACRILDSWLNGGHSEPIRSMSYFEPLIAEIQAKPLPAGYSKYLNDQVQRLLKKWRAVVSGSV
jgi:hypothetical protein